MPYLRHSSPADNPVVCSFSTLMICSSVNLLLRMSVSLRERTLPKTGAFKGSRSRGASEREPLSPTQMYEQLWSLLGCTLRRKFAHGKSFIAVENIGDVHFTILRPK